MLAYVFVSFVRWWAAIDAFSKSEIIGRNQIFIKTQILMTGWESVGFNFLKRKFLMTH